MAKQLYMRADLSKTDSRLSLPEGYWLRHFWDTPNRADDRSWDRVIQASFGEIPHFLFERFIRPNEAFREERVMFICHEGVPVATASAWRYPWLEKDWGGIHMVGALKEHKGKGLGKLVSKAAMLRLKEEGMAWAWLTTDDGRLGAVKSYLDLGFEPVIVEDGQLERWSRVMENLGKVWEPDGVLIRKDL